jgi:hypothetical protein
VAAGARPASQDPGAALPARAALDQRRSAADGQADRPPRAGRVLGFLPRQLALFSLHYGEGAYAETEREIQELLEIEEEPLPPLRPEDAPGVLLPAQTEDQPGAYSGPYEAGGVWAVLDGAGELAVNGRAVTVSEPGCFPLVEHPHHTAGVLDLQVGSGVTCLATCFTPGVAAPDAPDRRAAAPAAEGRTPR